MLLLLMALAVSRPSFAVPDTNGRKGKRHAMRKLKKSMEKRTEKYMKKAMERRSKDRFSSLLALELYNNYGRDGLFLSGQLTGGKRSEIIPMLLLDLDQAKRGGHQPSKKVK